MFENNLLFQAKVILFFNIHKLIYIHIMCIIRMIMGFCNITEFIVSMRPVDENKFYIEHKPLHKSM